MSLVHRIVFVALLGSEFPVSLYAIPNISSADVMRTAASGSFSGLVDFTFSRGLGHVR
jgi:hypothetical protein